MGAYVNLYLLLDTCSLDQNVGENGTDLHYSISCIVIRRTKLYMYNHTPVELNCNHVVLGTGPCGLLVLLMYRKGPDMSFMSRLIYFRYHKQLCITLTRLYIFYDCCRQHL